MRTERLHDMTNWGDASITNRDKRHFLRNNDNGAAWREGFGAGMGLVPGCIVSTRRDADILTRSNWEVIREDLRNVSEHVSTVSASHPIVGWVEYIVVPCTDAIVERLTHWAVALSDYPVADEMHFSDLLWRGCDLEVWENCTLPDAISELPESLRDIYDDLSDTERANVDEAAYQAATECETYPDMDAALESLVVQLSEMAKGVEIG